ncbi:NADAR family protein [Aquimarina atlantica]|uniref:NADAR family protein n=1 Tax=Aquimarina atlantica TaxID=1317122 RepID=UPI000AD0F5C5|nr:NADAR family protein [Aquimarina atlantica]
MHDLYFYHYKIGTCKSLDFEMDLSVDIEFELDDWVENPNTPFAREIHNRVHQKQEYVSEWSDDCSYLNYIKNNHYSRGLNFQFDNQYFFYDEFNYLLSNEKKILNCGFLRKEKSNIENYSLFWETKHPFSQWYKCNFKEYNIEFSSAEQYMMYHKALLFNDKNTANKILETSNSRKCKELGREVKNFNVKIWNSKCMEIVYNGNLLKFKQNPDLESKLIDTEGKTIVESSPDDKIWGIGLHESDKNCLDRKKWKGTNWLGIVLTEIRENEY